jgi:hypothetical protein
LGRLEDIVARHQNKRPTARVLIWGAFAILLVGSVIALMFTDLAKPGVDPVTRPAVVAPTPPPPAASRVDGVLLRKAPAPAKHP